MLVIDNSSLSVCVKLTWLFRLAGGALFVFMRR